MIGKYEIEIYNNKVHYFLTVKRNITIIQGNSATGKTELIRLIQEYEANGVSSGISLICDAKCTVLTPVAWELRLSSIHGSIIFIDETAAFIKSKRFAELVKGSDNYYVIVTRDDLSQLPYSVDEIYGLKNVSDAQKYKKFKRVYNEMYRLYNFEIGQEFTPECVITEDSNSGYDFYDLLYPGKCISSNGKSNIYDCIRREHDKTTLVIVDGAAFGPEIGKIFRYLQTNNTNCIVYAPESFEYLILCAEIFDVPKEILQKTYDYADSAHFISWEDYFTSYLTNVTRNTIYQYGKARLNETYKNNSIIMKIAAVVPDEIKINKPQN